MMHGPVNIRLTNSIIGLIYFFSIYKLVQIDNNLLFVKGEKYCLRVDYVT